MVRVIKMSVENIPKELQKGCYLCLHLQFESGDYGPQETRENDFFYCDKREDQPEENFKTFPALRRLSCFEMKREGPLKLSTVNIKQWKRDLDRMWYPVALEYGFPVGISNSMTDDEFIEKYLGEEVSWAVDQELEGFFA